MVFGEKNTIYAEILHRHPFITWILFANAGKKDVSGCNHRFLSIVAKESKVLETCSQV